VLNFSERIIPEIPEKLFSFLFLNPRTLRKIRCSDRFWWNLSMEPNSNNINPKTFDPSQKQMINKLQNSSPKNEI
jgi:hypothetical protein